MKRLNLESSSNTFKNESSSARRSPKEDTAESKVYSSLVRQETRSESSLLSFERPLLRCERKRLKGLSKGLLHELRQKVLLAAK